MVFNEGFYGKLDPPLRKVDLAPKRQLPRFDSLSERVQPGDSLNAHAQDWNTPSAQQQVQAKGQVLYDELKSLWWIFRVLGLFPLQMNTVGKATFRCGSKQMIYSLCFYMLMNVIVGFELREKINLLLRSRKEFDSVVFSLMMIMYILPHIWLPLRHYMGTDAFANLMNDWTTFQADFLQLTRHHLRLRLRHRCTALVVLTVVVSYLFVTGEYYVMDSSQIQVWEIFYFGYASLLLNLHLLLWYLLCSVSVVTSRQMMRHLEQDFSRSSRSTSELMAHYRHLWLDLSRLTRQFGQVFCYQFCQITLFWFTSFVLSTYHLSSITSNPTFVHLGELANGAILFASIMTFCLSAQSATDEVGDVVKQKLQKMRSDDIETRQQLFENTICHNLPVISLGGYVEVNRRLAVSMFSTTATYLVVMVQFSMANQSGAHLTDNGTTSYTSMF